MHYGRNSPLYASYTKNIPNTKGVNLFL